LAIPLHNRLSGGDLREDEFLIYDCKLSGCRGRALTSQPRQPDGIAWSTA